MILSKTGGDFPGLEQFGERLATGFNIVQKTKSGSENVVQMIRDELSGWIGAFPLTKRDADTVAVIFLSFVVPHTMNPTSWSRVTKREK